MWELAACRACNSGDLVPLSDFDATGPDIQFKAWVCTNPCCGFNLKVRNGHIRMNEPICGRDEGQ